MQRVGRDACVAQFSEDRQRILFISSDIIGEFFVYAAVFLGADKDGIDPSAGQCIRGFDKSADVCHVAVLILLGQNDAAFFLAHKFSFLMTDPVVPCRICFFLFQKPVSVFSLYRFYVVAQDNSYFQSRAYSTKYDIESGITKKRRSSLSKSVDGFFSLSLRCMLYFAPAGADFPAAITSRTANDGERTQVRGSVCWEPWVCAPQQKHESPRLESR